MAPPSRARRIVVSTLLAYLVTLAYLLIAGRWFPQVLDVFYSSDVSWFHYVVGHAGPPWYCPVGLFALTWSLTFALARRDRFYSLSWGLGLFMSVIPVIAIVLALLPWRLTRYVEAAATGEPPALRMLPGPSPVVWLLLALLCLAVWQFGRWIGTGAYAAGLKFNVIWRLLLVATGAAVFWILIALEANDFLWPVWSLLAGMLIGWGHRRTPAAGGAEAHA